MKNRLFAIMVYLMAMAGLFVVDQGAMVFASNDGTGGGGSSICTSNCGTPSWWGVYPSKDGTGGISWKIFRTKSEYYSGYKLYKTSYEKGPIYCKDKSKQDSSAKCSTTGSLKDFGYDKKLATKCSKAGYDWYLALTFDGWYKTDKSKVRYFGPASVSATYKNSKGNYSKYYRSKTLQTKNQLSKEQVLTRLTNGTLAEGSRVEPAVAKYFCKKDTDGELCKNYSSGTLPDGLGYICVNSVAKYEAKITISGSKSDTTDWQDDTKKMVSFIDNCSSTDGCKVRFSHHMRTSGDGSSDYSIAQESNLTTTDKAIAKNTNLKTGSFSGSDTEVYKSPEFTLYPGMIVCESNKFNYTSGTNKKATLRVCVVALGVTEAKVGIKVKNSTLDGSYADSVYAKPSDKLVYRSTYNPEPQYTTEIVPQAIKIGDSGRIVPNSASFNGGSYDDDYDDEGFEDDWGDEDDDDDAEYAEEDSFVDESGDEDISDVDIDIDIVEEHEEKPKLNIKNFASGLAFGASLKDLFNNNKGNLNSWNNGYAVTSGQIGSISIPGCDNLALCKYDVGDITKRKEAHAPYTVSMGHVGRELKEIASTNGLGGIKFTPAKIQFLSNSDYVDIAKIFENPAWDTASAYVPYNFNTDVRITDDNDGEDEKLIYAGEDGSVSFDVDIIPRYNPVTMKEGEPDYATKVNGAKYKIIVYSGQEKTGTVWANNDLCAYYGLPNDEVHCGYSKEQSGAFGPTDVRKQYETTTNSVSSSFNAQDKNAGERICVAAAFYPASSGGYDNWQDPEGSHTWRISASKCFKVAKRPSIQIWGGNLYSKGQIKTSVSTKNNVAGVTGYSVSSKNTTNYIFGSFGELGVISSGAVSGFASASGTGYVFNNGAGLVPNPFGVNNGTSVGGSQEGTPSICIRSRLTFANTNSTAIKCAGNGAVGSIGNSQGAAAGERDLASVTARFANPGEPNADGTVSIEDGQEYLYSKENLSLDTSSVSRGVHVIQSDKNINIVGDITYSGSYSKLNGEGAVPKIVVYAKGNITISCEVRQIDALLVAEGSVKTCDSDDINSSRNSNQLRINGAIITAGLIPNRTYGAATGANSIVPAEIINFDPTLYLWGGSDDDENSSGTSTSDISNLDVTYVRELPARR